MNYTIRVIPPPEMITVNGLNGPETRPAPDGWVKPQSYVQLIYQDGDVQLWEDVNGVATWSEIKAAINIVGKLQKEVRLQAGRVIFPKWPIEYQLNCIDGTYSTATQEQYRADKQSVINESNRCEDLIENATSLEQALAVVPIWPVI
jgi:hypothetical protein